ncbi:MAG: UvrD-helicase domain-containing protein, partial [Firmicutes bacterium]|nr:UvrD-helicase domain-containing protein [Bacillota bacterium]
MQTLTINTKQTVLSDVICVYKTESFVKGTYVFFDIDRFLSKLAESLILNISKISSGVSYIVHCNGESLFFTFTNNNIIFYKYLGTETFVRKEDRRFYNFLAKENIEVTYEKIKTNATQNELSKQYRLFSGNYSYFPRLDITQQQIVNIEDQNVLVQGVAGSGKTNICIDKIVFAASRGYSGRTLYSTFSRGLLADTKEKVIEYSTNIKYLLLDLKQNNVKFCGQDKVKAIENKLGISLMPNAKNITESLQCIIDYLDSKVDYFLLEDLYALHINQKVNFADENVFISTFLNQNKNYQLKTKLEKLEHLSYEVIYKEIFGLIGGFCNPEKPNQILTLDEYAELRAQSFTSFECQTIYLIAKEYFTFLEKNSYVDNNIISRKLLENLARLPKYSLIILDEVQDFTQVNLVLFKSLCLKMFCVGDALQMINASYFSFAYLKRLLYQEDLSSVCQLVSNYRNTKRIADITENLST